MTLLLLLTVGIAVGVALHVDLPWGGRLTLGHALLIALVARAEPPLALAVATGGIILALPSWLHHADEGSLVVRLGGAGGLLAATFGAVATRVALDGLGLAGGDRGTGALAYAAAIGVAFLAVDHVVRSIVLRSIGERSDLRQAWPLYVTLLCVAVLIDLVQHESGWLALIAVVPLLVTRFSFQRYTTARVTYEQTTRALSLLPEVAGLTPLGHSERTAAYVEAVADDLGYDTFDRSRLANAARLHHIGHISLHEETERHGPPDPVELAHVSVDILKETGFLTTFVDLIEDCQPGGAPASTLDAAVVRVCSTLDDIVEDPAVVDPFAELVALHPVGHERTVAIALLSLSHRRPSLVTDARAAVELIHEIAAKAASSAHHDH